MRIILRYTYIHIALTCISIWILLHGHKFNHLWREGNAVAKQPVGIRQFEFLEDLGRELEKIHNLTTEQMQMRRQKPKIVIIFAGAATGGTFLNELLHESVMGSWNYYEPLAHFDLSSNRAPPHLFGAAPPKFDVAAHIENLLQCNYTHNSRAMQRFMDFALNDYRALYSNYPLKTLCFNHSIYCETPELLTQYCRLFPVRVMRIKRVPATLALMKRLLELANMDVHLLLLSRDPRAIVYSCRDRNTWCLPMRHCFEPQAVCWHMLQQYKAFQQLSTKYPQRLHILKYEQFFSNLNEQAAKLFKFLQVPFEAAATKFIVSHTTRHIEGMDSTYRITEKALKQWACEWNGTAVMKIQNQPYCRKALLLWKYRLFTSASEYETFCEK